VLHRLGLIGKPYHNVDGIVVLLGQIAGPLLFVDAPPRVPIFTFGMHFDISVSGLLFFVLFGLWSTDNSKLGSS
jgi:hypothetical protein